MKLKSINPSNGILIEDFEELQELEIDSKIKLALEAFNTWKKTSLNIRKEKVINLKNIILESLETFSRQMTLETGKPIVQSRQEIQKVVEMIDYYIQNFEEMLKAKKVKTKYEYSEVRYEPLGPILTIMPWNFPYWQALRTIIPLILAGNTVVLKHASNVCRTALNIQELFDKAKFGSEVMQTLLISSSKVERIIRNPIIEGVILTGSEKAGASVASIAGQEIKKVALELGGNDAFIVLEDADIDDVIDNASKSRLRNAGQSCNAAKRFIVHETKYDEFVKGLKQKFEQVIVEDPLKETCEMGPLSSLESLETHIQLVNEAVNKGAKLITGGSKKDVPGFFMQPTILTQVNSSMKIFNEETFAPIATVFAFKEEDEALEIANATKLGLGASIWTENIERAKKLIPKLNVGNVYVNEVVRSTPELPFGGSKKSGIGRELAEYGLLEFTNVKSVVIND